MMSEGDYGPDTVHECAGCVDAAAYGQAISMQLVFQASALWCDPQRHGSFGSVIEAGRHVFGHAKRQIDEGFTHRLHTCNNGPARCQSCLLPLICGRCMNACCGFHRKHLFQADRWLLLRNIPMEQVQTSDNHLIDMQIIRRHPNGMNQWPHSVFVQMNGELVIATPCIRTRADLDEILRIEASGDTPEINTTTALQI